MNVKQMLESMCSEQFFTKCDEDAIEHYANVAD